MKLEVTEKEVERLCAAVIEARGKGTLSPDDIREATGNAPRSLGEEGKKNRYPTPENWPQTR